METNYNVAIELLKAWFEKAELWQKDLFTQVWNGETNEEKLKKRSLDLIHKEYGIKECRFKAETKFPSLSNIGGENVSKLYLDCISNVNGVGALCTNSPLKFGKGITVVYGENGSGKSSYTRILKNAENPKSQSVILGNVFSDKKVTACANLEFLVDEERKVFKWTVGSKTAYPIKVYDSILAKQFVDVENEMVYEPRVLKIISILSQIYEYNSVELTKESSAEEAKMSAVPNEFVSEEITREYAELSLLEEVELFSKKYSEYIIDKDEIRNIEEALATQNPKAEIEAIKTKVGIVNDCKNSITKLLAEYGECYSEKFLRAYQELSKAEEKYKTLLNNSSSLSVLPEFGTEQWDDMWRAVESYRLLVDDEYDNVCPVCQREYDDSTSERIDNFNKFAHSEVRTIREQKRKAFASFEKDVQAILESDLNIIKVEQILVSNTIEVDIKDAIIDLLVGIRSMLKALIEKHEYVPVKITITEVNNRFQGWENAYNDKINALENVISNYSGECKRVNSLKATQWIIEHLDELEQKRTILKLKTAIAKCKTNSLTTLKKELTKVLITDTYIDRFNSEMEQLDVKSKINVELVSKGARKGKSYHQVILKNVEEKQKVGDVLSEGEFKVVSLAAFLADLTSWNTFEPFVFDDPITSLDHKFEKRVANRLILLAKERQVIVFTHRLNFANLINNVADDLEFKNIEYVELRDKPLGQPMNNPTVTKRFDFKSAVNRVKNDLNPLKRHFDNGDYESYELGLKGMCENIREILEAGIENTLLSGIVRRFDYSVSSQKVRYLNAIKPEDIQFFDSLMTKYSTYVHSQSIELPSVLPELTEVENDISDMLTWENDFKKRAKQYNKR